MITLILFRQYLAIHCSVVLKPAPHQLAEGTHTPTQVTYRHGKAQGKKSSSQWIVDSVVLSTDKKRVAKYTWAVHTSKLYV